jgi:hypothetical protein
VTFEVACPTCHHRARWSAPGEVVEVLQEGGSRRAAVPEALASWRIWRAARAGATGPVVGPCPACGLPLPAVAPGAPGIGSATLTTPIGEVRVADDGVWLDGVVADPDDVDARLEAALAPRISASDVFDVRNAFALAFLAMLGTITLIWLVAALFLIRFVMAMGMQNNVTIPLPP